ncbi:DUF6454 family protein [Sphingomonas sp. DG1-23]|uniref:DUF6454 family protein n=1 Tax=Sphingomonas sp. DG1-23 TaxID=3068316 RepID=UPI00273F6EB8|nr:DUF6454 family protein [Sphingomonas sp. DG1-23]MDP5280341.1 DUF6454 family protein [Sphingomonas sp. DG1-23]
MHNFAMEPGHAKREVKPMLRKILRSSLPSFILVLSSLSVAAAPDPLDHAIENAHLLALSSSWATVSCPGSRTRCSAHLGHLGRSGQPQGYIHEFDRRGGKLLCRLELTGGARYHPGGISLSGRSIWIPVAEMKAKSSAVLVEVDADSLEIRRKIHVPDHLGCVAASGDTLVAGNWDSETLYIFDLRSNAQVRTVPNPL